MKKQCLPEGVQRKVLISIQPFGSDSSKPFQYKDVDHFCYFFSEMLTHRYGFFIQNGVELSKNDATLYKEIELMGNISSVYVPRSKSD